MTCRRAVAVVTREPAISCKWFTRNECRIYLGTTHMFAAQQQRPYRRVTELRMELMICEMQTCLTNSATLWRLRRFADLRWYYAQNRDEIDFSDTFVPQVTLWGLFSVLKITILLVKHTSIKEMVVLKSPALYFSNIGHSRFSVNFQLNSYGLLIIVSI